MGPWEERKASSAASPPGLQQEGRPEFSPQLCPNSFWTLGQALPLWASVSPAAQWEVDELLTDDSEAIVMGVFDDREVEGRFGGTAS